MTKLDKDREEVCRILDARDAVRRGAVKKDASATLARVRAEVEPRAARGAVVNASVILAILDEAS